MCFWPSFSSPPITRPSARVWRPLVVDASEELREREETSLEQLMAGSRILVGAVSHEVRNVSRQPSALCMKIWPVTAA